MTDTRTVITLRDSGTASTFGATGATPDGVALGTPAVATDGTRLLSHALSAADVRALIQRVATGIGAANARFRREGLSGALLYFDLFQFQNVPYRAADKARWDALASAKVSLDTTEAGAYVVNVLPADTGKLASVNVGDPISLTLDRQSWTTAPHTSGFPLAVNYAYFWAVVVAIGASTITLSRPLPWRISRDTIVDSKFNNFYAHYAWTDFAHPFSDALFAQQWYLWNPTRLRYEFAVGTRLATVNQLTAGTTVSGGASVAAATWDVTATAWPLLPGHDPTANATFDITLNANGAAVRVAGATCASGLLHIARCGIVAKAISGAGSLTATIVDGSGTVVGSAVLPAMHTGIDLVNVPFTPSATGTHYLRLAQVGATDASCYVSEVEYRQIPADGMSQALPTTGAVYYAGDSNSLQSAACYLDGLQSDTASPGELVLAMITPNRGAVGDNVTGRTMVAQAKSIQNTLGSTIYALAISHDTGNSAQLAVRGTAEDHGPFEGSVVTNASRVARAAYYWTMQAAAQSELVLVLGKNRDGFDGTNTYTAKDAEFTRVIRAMLDW